MSNVQAETPGGFGSRWAMVCGSATVATGLLLLVRGRLDTVWIAPTQRAASAGLVLCGLGLLLSMGRESFHKWSQLCAYLVGLLGLLTLLQNLVETRFRIDQLFMPANVSSAMPHPGRMPPLTCICFLLVALGMIALRNPPAFRWSTAAAAVASTLQFSIALACLLNDLPRKTTRLIWTQTAAAHTSAMATSTAACFLLLSSSLIVRAWFFDIAAQTDAAGGRQKRRAPDWVPYSIGIAAIMSFLWLLNSEINQLGVAHVVAFVATIAATMLLIVVLPMEAKPRIAIGLGMSVVILFFTGLLSLRTLKLNDESQTWVAHTHIVLEHVDTLVTDMGNAESAYRGYLWTGQPEELDGWQQGIPQIRRDLSALRFLTQDNPRQKRNLDQVETALDVTIAITRSRIAIQEQRGNQAGADAFRKDRAWRPLSQVMGKIQNVREEENGLMRVRMKASDVSSQQAKFIVILGNALAMLFLVISGGIASSEMRGRVKAETFRGLLESAPDAMVVMDHKGTMMLVNAQTEKLFGYAREDLLQKEIEMLVEHFRSGHPGDLTNPFVQQRLKEMGDGPELYGRRKDGTRFPIEISLSPLETERGMLVSSAIRDISEHRHIENRLRSQAASLSQQAALLDIVPDSIIVRDVEGAISFWNHGAEVTYGWSKEEAIGQRSHQLLQTRFPAEFDQLLATLVETGRWEGELEHCRQDGSSICVASRWVLNQVDPASPPRVLEINNDITARKRSEDEIRRLNMELERRIADLTAVNQELEAFTYTAAHDLRAPLRHMHGFAALLREAWYDKLDDDGRHCLDKIATSSRGMGQLLDDLLNFSRLGRLELKLNRVHLGTLVEQIRLDLQAELNGRSVTWVVGELPEVAGDPSLLHQMLFNLVSNAIKYTSKRQHAQIEIGSEAEDDGNITIFVRDNGAGFEMDYAGNLFRVFQRLHTTRDFEGTGIGLAIVRRIVERHGGRVWAQGYPQEGATFYVSLPTRRQDDGKIRVHPSSGR